MQRIAPTGAAELNASPPTGAGSGRDSVLGMAKRIRLEFPCAAPAGMMRWVTVRATATETEAGVYAIDAGSIVVETASPDTVLLYPPAFTIEDV